MNRSNGLYNILTLLFTLLTIVVCVLIVLLFTKTVQPPVAFSPATALHATIALLPSDTPTTTPSLTPLPTDTDVPTSTKIPTKTPSFTAIPSDTPTVTDTFTATATATATLTSTRIPTNTKTLKPPTPTIDPSIPTKTPVGFPFRLQEGAPSYTANLNTAVGCAFQGIGGQVFGMNKEPLPNITISVTSPTGFSQTTASGSNPRYGTAGWEVQTGAQAISSSYVVELRNDKGVPLSIKVPVTFSGACNQNLALINFFQTRPF